MKRKLSFRLKFIERYRRPGEALDIGNLDANAKQHFRLIEEFPESNWHGIDIVDQAIVGLQIPRQTRGTAEAMPYSDASFDTVYAGEVLEHVWQPLDIVKEVQRILKPGGRFILHTPNVYSLKRILQYIFGDYEDIYGQPEHKLCYTREMVRKMLETAGFKVLEITSCRQYSFSGKKYSMPDMWPFREGDRPSMPLLKSHSDFAFS